MSLLLGLKRGTFFFRERLPSLYLSRCYSWEQGEKEKEKEKDYNAQSDDSRRKKNKDKRTNARSDDSHRTKKNIS
jgi:hypothetical protein